MSDIEWYGPERGKGSVGDVVSHLPGVIDAVREKGRDMANDADLLLAAHRLRGHAEINLVTGDVDTYIVLQDHIPSDEDSGGNTAMSIEYGWTQRTGFRGEPLDAPIKHGGLHILGSVMKQHMRRGAR